MKKYVALLRGININGKNKISMSVLKTEFESAGFSEVTTYLNSGNIVFESDTDSNKIIIEKMILDKFGLEIPVYVMEMDALIDIMLNAPDWWGTDSKEYYDSIISLGVVPNASSSKFIKNCNEDVMKLVKKKSK